MNGRVSSERKSIGRATTRATASGYIRPNRLGTSSPKMMVMNVTVTTTIAVEVMWAACSLSGKVPCSHSANGDEKAASPTMPLSIADRGDAHLHHRQELGRVLVQVERGLCSGIAGFQHHLEPCLAARGQRHLGHGEERIQYDQEEQEGNVHAGRAAMGERVRVAETGSRPAERRYDATP